MIRPNFLWQLSFGTKFSEHPNLSTKALPTISVFLDLFGFVAILCHRKARSSILSYAKNLFNLKNKIKMEELNANGLHFDEFQKLRVLVKNGSAVDVDGVTGPG